MFVTPRKIAWALLLSGLIWFVITSPKTPLQFFDAACRDKGVFDVLTEQRAAQIASKYAQVQKNLMSVYREMNRMTLSYDVIHNPARVQQERSSILGGFYQASPQTHEAMTQNNSTYRSVAEQFEKMKIDLKASLDSASDSLVSRQVQEDLRIKRFQAEMDRMILRQFQAEIFWRVGQ